MKLNFNKLEVKKMNECLARDKTHRWFLMFDCPWMDAYNNKCKFPLDDNKCPAFKKGSDKE